MLKIPRIHGAIALADYAPEMGEQTLRVWLNVPLERLEALRSALATGEAAELYGWLAEVWPDVNASEIEAFAADCARSDPALLTWLARRTLELIVAHRAGAGKN